MTPTQKIVLFKDTLKKLFLFAKLIYLAQEMQNTFEQM